MRLPRIPSISRAILRIPVADQNTRAVDHGPLPRREGDRPEDLPHPPLVCLLESRPPEEIPGETAGVFHGDGATQPRTIRDGELPVHEGEGVGPADPGTGTIYGASVVRQEAAPVSVMPQAPAEGDRGPFSARAELRVGGCHLVPGPRTGGDDGLHLIAGSEDKPCVPLPLAAAQATSPACKPDPPDLPGEIGDLRGDRGISPEAYHVRARCRSGRSSRR